MKIKTIRLKTRPRRKSRATSLWNALTGKRGSDHRLPAHVTGESDWEVEVPQIRMSRAFAVMLVLHIVAVGGLFAFRIWGRDADKKEAADNATAAVTGREPAASLVSVPKAAESAATDPKEPAEPLKIYTWHAGDTLQLVAARFNVSAGALRDANPGKELSPGTEIVVPRAGRIIGGAEVAHTGQAAAIFDPLAPKETAAPKAEAVPELAATAPVPDVIPPPADETPHTQVQKVSAQISAKPAGTSKAAVSKTETASSKSASKGEPVIARTVPKSENTTTKSAPKPEANKPPRAELVTTKSKPEQSTPKPKVKVADNDTPARSGGQRVHVVTKGDTVFNVAKRFGFTASEIAKANNLGGDYRIQLGQQLRIPVRR